MLTGRTRTTIVFAAAISAFLSLVVEARACPWLNMEIAVPVEVPAEPICPDEKDSAPPIQNVVSYQSCDPNTTGNGPARWFAAKTDRVYRDREGKIQLKSWLDFLVDALAPRISDTIAYQTHGTFLSRWVVVLSDIPVPLNEYMHSSIQPLAPPCNPDVV